MPKGSKEGTKFRVKHKAKKKLRFKGKLAADMRKDGDALKGNCGSQSTCLENSNNPDQAVDNEDISILKSTSARKLEQVNLELPQTPEEEGVTTRQSLQEQEQEGYRIVYVDNIRKTVESMHKCKNGTIITSEDASKRAGLSSCFHFECTECKQKVEMVTSRSVEGKASSFDVNRRTNFAMGELGLGREALATICEILNMPPPVTDRAYQQHNCSVNLATKKSWKKS